MYLKCTMSKPNIYTIWYIECNSIFLMKLEWGNTHGNVFSGTVFLKVTLIWIKSNFP